MQESPLILVRRQVARKYPTLLAQHPLNDRNNDEDRLQYLALLAFSLAVGREPSPVESTAFTAFAERIGIPEHEALEQLGQRASLDWDTLEILLQTLQMHQLHWAWLMDVVWQQSMDGKTHADDVAVVAELANHWEIKQSWLVDFRQWAEWLRAREYQNAQKIAKTIKNYFPKKFSDWLDISDLAQTHHIPTAKNPILIELKIPNHNDFNDAIVIDLLIEAGDFAKKGQPLIKLELEEKFTIISSPENGCIIDVYAPIGYKVWKGMTIITMEVEK